MVNTDSFWAKVQRRLLFAFSRYLPDRWYLERLFPLMVGYPLDLDHPKTFNEKLQWLKLYNRKTEYTQMVDKIDAKKYVASIIGEEYIIPTLAVYNSVEEIDFDALPSQFVLKCSHDSGGVVICKDKALLDREAAKRKLKKCLKNNFYWRSREWPYKNVKPRILAEKYMENIDNAGFHGLKDYKLYCFNGVPLRMLYATDRQSEGDGLRFDYFDWDFNHLKLTNHWHPNSAKFLSKPSLFEKMKELARKLSLGIPHVRVDFYEVNNHVYFGEMTFFDMGGYLRIHPDEWDLEWGRDIALPLNSCHKEE